MSRSPHPLIAGDRRSETLPPPAAGTGISALALGFYVGLGSLTVLFGATLFAYALVRAGHPAWRDPALPTLLPGFIAATMLLAAVSAALELARASIARNRPRAATGALRAAGASALGYLVVQVLNWWVLALAAARIELRTLYPFTLYMVTGVHAAHVLLGLIPLALVLQRMHHGAYSSSRHEAVRLLGHYWHYLGVVWLVLFMALAWGSA